MQHDQQDRKPGKDLRLYPWQRTYMFGVDVTF